MARHRGGEHVSNPWESADRGEYEAALLKALYDVAGAGLPVQDRQPPLHLVNGHGHTPADLWEGMENTLDPGGSQMSGTTGNHWAAEDLTDILDGTRVPVVPELGTRSDGVRLLYRGKEHVVAGEPESGKTWFMLKCAHDVLVAGGRVTYVDFEDDAPTVVGRLVDLGTVKERLRPAAGQFRYVRPDIKPRHGELAELLAFPEGPADLLIYDGWTEGAELMGLKINDQGDMAVWRRHLVRPALSLGAAVLTSDHVVKDKEHRGRYSIGAQHKLAGLTGVMFLVDVAETWGRGSKGRSRILIAKDRPGSLRPHGKRDDKANFTHIGDLVGDASSGQMDSLVLWPPFEEKPQDEGDIPHYVRLHIPAVVQALKSPEAPLGSNAIFRRCGGKRDDVLTALDWMVDNGHISVAAGSNRTKLHTLVHNPLDDERENDGFDD